MRYFLVSNTAVRDILHRMVVWIIIVTVEFFVSIAIKGTFLVPRGSYTKVAVNEHKKRDTLLDVLGAMSDFDDGIYRRMKLVLNYYLQLFS